MLTYQIVTILVGNKFFLCLKSVVSVPHGGVLEVGHEGPHGGGGGLQLGTLGGGGTYDAIRPRPRSGTARVLTPACTVRILSAGYQPQVHGSAHDLLNGSASG